MRESHVSEAKPVSKCQISRRIRFATRFGTTGKPGVSDLPVALVTGARKGLGQHVSRSLVTAGYEVVGCSRGAAESSDHYTHLEADVGDESRVKMLLENIRRRFGRLDAAINNAGISSMNHSLLMPAETVKRIFDTNFMGTFLVSREAGKIMSRRKAGRIVNLTTIAVPMEVEGEAIYAASKSAVESLTRICPAS
jgi:3-oxoacyl-[acyl-carrier protein] reductase